jgi:hypothetical protein
MALINLLLKPKCMLKHILNFFIFFCIRKNDIIFFLSWRDLAVCMKTKYFFVL